jgi:hypothetical protein
MDLIADILMVAGALGAAIYCAVLARCLRRFNDLEKGVGGAVAVLSAQVDDMTRTLRAAQDTSMRSEEALDRLTKRAESTAQRLELMMASLHDLPADTPPAAAPDPPPRRQGEPMFIRHARNGSEGV